MVVVRARVRSRIERCGQLAEPFDGAAGFAVRRQGQSIRTSFSPSIAQLDHARQLARQQPTAPRLTGSPDPERRLQPVTLSRQCGDRMVAAADPMGRSILRQTGVVHVLVPGKLGDQVRGEPEETFGLADRFRAEAPGWRRPRIARLRVAPGRIGGPAYRPRRVADGAGPVVVEQRIRHRAGEDLMDARRAKVANLASSRTFQSS